MKFTKLLVSYAKFPSKLIRSNTLRRCKQSDWSSHSWNHDTLCFNSIITSWTDISTNIYILFLCQNLLKKKTKKKKKKKIDYIAPIKKHTAYSFKVCLRLQEFKSWLTSDYDRLALLNEQVSVFYKLENWHHAFVAKFTLK